MGFEQDRDLETKRQKLADWAANTLENARDVAVHELRAPGNGFANETLLFDLEWTGDQGRERRGLVARLEPDFKIFPEYDLGRQFRVLEKLWDTPVPVPRVFWHEPDPAPLGSPFFVMERVAGEIPPDRPPYHIGGWCTELAPDQQQALWWSGVDALVAIHRLDWRALGLDFLAPQGPGKSSLDKQLAEYRHFLAWTAGDRPQPVVEAALAWLEANRPADEPLGLCWGDARIGNMIFHEQRCAAVLDWEMVTLGNPEQDLGWWLFLDWHHSQGIGAPRLPGLPSREESIARWEEGVGRPAKHVHYYEVFAGFRFAIIMIRVTQHMDALGVPHPEDFETNNPCTGALAHFLGIPRPGA